MTLPARSGAAALARSDAAARRAWHVFVAGYSMVWIVLLSGVLAPVDQFLSDLAQLAMCVVASVLLWRNSATTQPVLGSGTRYVALGLTVMTGAEAVWTALAISGQPRPEALDLAYAGASILMAAGAFNASRSQMWPRSPASRGRSVVDLIMLVASALLLWRSVVAASNPDLAVFDRTVVLMGVSDSIFLVFGITAWVQALPGRRRPLRLVAVAALVMYVVDMWHVSMPFQDGHEATKWLDAGWTLAAALLAKCTIGVGRSRWRRIRGLSRWIGACLPPLAALGVVMISTFDFETGSRFPSLSFPGLGYASLTLAVLIVIRQLLFAAEQFDLIDRVEAASRRQAHFADHDDLTGVLARRAFFRRASEVVADHRTADSSGQLGLLWIDVDDFKRVNDTFGHAAGDWVLQTVAERLKNAVRAGDIVGRLGGDEFVVLRPDLNTSAVSWAEHLARVVTTPIEVGGATVRVGCSAGVVRSDGSDELDDLLVDGDLALLDAKRKGRGRVVEFTSTHTDLLGQTRVLADHVRSALKRGKIIVRYQPIVDFETGSAVAAEALVRLADRDGSELQPGDFMELIELQGLLPRLFDLVLEQSLGDFATIGELRVSINATTSDVTGPGFVARVHEALLRHKVAPRRLVLELNERVTPQRRVVEVVQALNDIGVRVALDDFGTQWSRIDQVQALTPAFVKLDRDLVSSPNRPEQPGTGMLFGAMSLAKAFGAKVIAEGIETPGQAAAARTAGADLGQGWYWSEDLSISELRARLRLIGLEESPLPENS